MKFLAPLAASGLLLSATAGFAQMAPADPAVPGTVPGTTMPTDPSTVPPVSPADPTTSTAMPGSTAPTSDGTMADHDQHKQGKKDGKKNKDRSEAPN